MGVYWKFVGMVKQENMYIILHFDTETQNNATPVSIPILAGLPKQNKRKYERFALPLFFYN